MKQILILCAVLLLAACSDKEEKRRLPASKGLPCELLVVADPDVLRSGVADSIKLISESDVPGLGSGEDCFRSMTISTKGYERIYRVMHSQLFVRLDPKATKPVWGVAYNVDAKPQIEVEVKASNLEDLGKFLSEKREEIQQKIIDFQLDKMACEAQKKYSKKIAKDLQSVSGYTICMPKEMGATKRGKNFLWGGTNRNTQDMNFVCYTLPWQGQDIRDVDLLMHWRDSVMQKNIPGAKPDQWMTTTRVDDKPVVECRMANIGGKQEVEVRGLWELHNGFMGGPFVSLVFIDSVAKKIVATEGFVYSPSTSKRDLVRNVEASLRTLKKVSGQK